MQAQPRPARRASRRRQPLARFLPDLLALALLGLVGAGLLLQVLRRPPEPLVFAADAPPAGVAWHGFYDLERNAAGGYRWSKPEAALILPVTAPAVYRVTLTLQDAPAAQPRRPVTVYAGQVAAGRFTLDETPRDYTVEHRLAPAEWAEGRLGALIVELQAAPFHPPNDPRALGVIVTRVAVEPVAPPSPWQPAVLAPLLLLLAAVYGTLRGLGLGVGWAAGALVAALAVGALPAVAARDAALALVHEAAAQPLGLLATAALLAATPLIARAGARDGPHPAVLADGDPLPILGEGGGRGRAAAGSRLSRGRALPAGVGEALLLFVALRVAFSLFGALAAAFLPVRPPCDGIEDQVAPPLHATGLDFSLFGVWQHWDACWYEQIAATGYRPGDPSIAFFPLFPLLLRLASLPLAGHLTLGGLVVSGAAYVAAMTGLHRLVARDFDTAIARRATLALSLFPTAFFLFVPYSEALFLALAVWSLYLARTGAWGGAAGLALLAGVARPQGCLLALPLAWEAYRQWRDCPDPRRRALLAATPLLPVASLGLFLLYGQRVVGETAVRTQSAQWGNVIQAPWVVVAASLERIRRHGDAMETLNLAAVALCLLALLLGLRRLPLSYSLYAAPQLLLIAIHQHPVSPLLSAPRFVLVIFPVFVVLALAARWRAVWYPWLAGSALLLGWLTYLYVSGPLIA